MSHAVFFSGFGVFPAVRGSSGLSILRSLAEVAADIVRWATINCKEVCR